MTEIDHTMHGKTCLVTGATRGLGEAAAIGLARMGAKVFVAGRNPARLQATLERIRAETGSTTADGILADLSSMSEVRRVADDFLSRGEALDVLINNVGATMLQYQRSSDGMEMTWALNYLGHFLLTNLLLPALRNAKAEHGEARVIEITSSMYRLISPKLERLQQEQGYNGVKAYAQSKRALMLFTAEMARRLEGSGVTINVLAPGFVRTGIAGNNGFFANLAMQLVSLFSMPLEKGVQSLLYMAVDPTLRGTNGAYYRIFHRDTGRDAFGTVDDRAHLWRISQKQTGLTE
jgi:NAD(P)-dependent dehydrogenase (short-subunit alcohol dehydrogenase family)